MLGQRVITACILALVYGLSILFAGSMWVSFLFAVALFVATQELSALTLKLNALPGSLLAAGFVLFFWFSLSLINLQLLYWQSLAGVGVWILVALALPLYRYNGKWPLLVQVIMLGLGLDLLWICIHGLVYLHQYHGGWILLYLVTLVWVADIGAYFSGRRFGKHKFAPGISPGKTWEGVIGGVLVNLLWMVVVYFVSAGWGLSLMHFLLLGLVTSMFSVIGDLFESVLKREAGVKDSGKLLPGHGGVLDRIDSIIAASPVFVAGLFLLGLA